ncbi:Retrovirus-related Pol poly from transposon opus [Paramuricea clavata]|uniref:Retrovirus-related Pol poly from transposon opus n=1 Tax=Paramuricea clavata TaxID=317549 RepID=A0A6S7FUL6_PARCT|nr:Retrovirus-related Pol poly from transposon opus [Paramuricea clavata]
MTQLKQKHPEPQPAKLGSVLFGPLNDEIPESIYSQINGEMVRQAALRTKGSGGPSGVDANGFRRMLACKSFKQSSTRLCEAIARMTNTLCTQYIDPTTIEALIASRLIPLDKGEGAVRPIGVGEVIRRISAKCVMSFAKKDVVEASGSLQLCAGQKSGIPSSPRNVTVIVEGNALDVLWMLPEYPHEKFTSYSIKIQAVNYVGIGNSSAPVLAQTTLAEPFDDKSSNAGATAGAVIGGILFVILLLIVLFLLRRKILKRRHNEAVTGFQTWHLSRMDGQEPESESQTDQSEDLSYVAILMDWEIMPDSLKMLETTLGKGKFGIVKQGLLTTGESDPEVVAVKMLKGKKLSFN